MVHVRPGRVLRAVACVAALSVAPALAAVRCVPLGHPGPCTTFHSTIQAAVDAAADGDTILVAAGAYAEQVTVLGKSVSLLGARAGEDARGRGGPESVLTHPAGPLSVCGDGAAVDGFTLSGAVDPDAAWAGLVADASLCGAQIQMRVENNIVEDNIVGMSLGAGPIRVRRNWIRNNDVLPEFSHGILAGGSSDWTLEENRFEGHAVSSLATYGATRLTISRNRFDRGLTLFGTTDALLENNVELAAAPGAVLLEMAGDDHRVVVRDNVLKADSGVAIRLSNESGGPASSELTFHGNCIAGSGAVGLEVPAGTHTGSLDATSNWWGSTSGPSGVGPGSGAAIIDPLGIVAFVPFVGSGGGAACDCSLTPNGSPCDDGNRCTSGDACSAGQCVPGTATNCDDGDPCTIDTCQSSGGCTHVPMSCSDNNACTDGDHCDAGTCVPGTMTVCDDGNLCTDDSCNPATGGCQFAFNDRPCDDHNPCTWGDACFQGVCRYNQEKPCSDNNLCTDDFCDPADGSCYHVNDDTNFCATGTACVQCSAGACVPGCGDGIACTVDTCEPGVGCTHTTDNSACPSSPPCAIGWCHPTAGCQMYLPINVPCRVGCSAGRCFGGGTCAQIGPTETCGYPENCGARTCDVATGTCVDHGDPCDDGNACTTDFCANWFCQHTAPQCDDGDACTNDFCNAAGACAHSAVACNDGNPCTDDACSGGACVSTTDNSNTCADADICTTSQCVNGACVSTPGAADEIQGVRFTSKSGLGWNLAATGPGFAYDVVRGALAALPVGGAPGAEACIGHTTQNLLSDSQTPAAGSAYWYLVRVGYTLCEGTYGSEGNHGAAGAPRVTGACP